MLFNWAYQYFTYKRGARLITGHRLKAGAESDVAVTALPKARLPPHYFRLKLRKRRPQHHRKRLRLRSLAKPNQQFLPRRPPERPQWDVMCLRPQPRVRLAVRPNPQQVVVPRIAKQPNSRRSHAHRRKAAPPWPHGRIAQAACDKSAEQVGGRQR